LRVYEIPLLFTFQEGVENDRKECLFAIFSPLLDSSEKYQGTKKCAEYYDSAKSDVWHFTIEHEHCRLLSCASALILER
jgi:hypothetical protein